MKIEEIIDKLCNHEISKSDAIDEINIIVNKLRKDGAIEFIVDVVAYTVNDNTGYLKLKLPYQYSKIQDRVRAGDKVDVIFLF